MTIPTHRSAVDTLAVNRADVARGRSWTEKFIRLIRPYGGDSSTYSGDVAPLAYLEFVSKNGREPTLLHDTPVSLYGYKVHMAEVLEISEEELLFILPKTPTFHDGDDSYLANLVLGEDSNTKGARITKYVDERNKMHLNGYVNIWYLVRQSLVRNGRPSFKVQPVNDEDRQEYKRAVQVVSDYYRASSERLGCLGSYSRNFIFTDLGNRTPFDDGVELPKVWEPSIRDDYLRLLRSGTDALQAGIWANYGYSHRNGYGDLIDTKEVANLAAVEWSLSGFSPKLALAFLKKNILLEDAKPWIDQNKQLSEIEAEEVISQTPELWLKSWGATSSS